MLLFIHNRDVASVVQTAVAMFGGGTYLQASDPSVAFDAQDNVWLISTLGINGNQVDVLTSRSTNGGLTWGNPIVTATGSLDKNWIVCDNTTSSPFFGDCYTEYDITSGNAIRMTRSTDGGLTWGAALAPSGGATGLGGQPVVRPNGTVLVLDLIARRHAVVSRPAAVADPGRCGRSGP